MKNLLLLLIANFLLTGCASVQYNYTPKTVSLDFPLLNKATTVNVGDEMLIQGVNVELTVLRVSQPVTGLCFNVMMGDYTKVGDDEKSQYFNFIGTNGSAIRRGGLCDQISGLEVKREKPNEICVITSSGTWECNPAVFQIEELKGDLPTNWQRTLLYSGYDGKEIKFTYVERSRGIVTFSHDVSYDMKRSTEINYKGAQIHILNADNQKITYIVLRNFADRPQNKALPQPEDKMLQEKQKDEEQKRRDQANSFET
jgi:hypothetical protein